MEWRDEGVLLSVSRHGESSAIINVFTSTYGRHAGLVRGGGSRRLTPILQPGAQLAVHWNARLDNHLGAFTVEPVHSRTGLLADSARLAALNSVTALSMFCLSEREAHPRIYHQTMSFLERLELMPDWPAHYIGWELDLLEVLGFGLDIASCAVTSERTDLIYVSPKSGRAVSAAAGKDWADRLLVLPPFLRPDAGETPISAKDLTDGLDLTGYFLRHRVCPAMAKDSLPPARERLERAFRRF